MITNDRTPWNADLLHSARGYGEDLRDLGY
jgi:hypothetical protein